MKVLIIGGMGVIGGAIAEAALEAGHDVKLLCRTSPQGKWNSNGAKFIKGNWYDDNCAVPTVQEGFDVIVDTLIFDARLMERSAKLVDGHCKQLIYISTDSVYAHPASSLSENTDISLDEINWKYGINKRKAELYLLSHNSDFNFNWSVIRPTITFGDTRIPVGFASKRGTLSLIDRLEKGKPILRFDDGKTRHALCHTSVFGKAAIGLFLNDRAYGRFYHISDDTAYTYDEIFKVLEDITGKKALFAFADANALKKYDPDAYNDMVCDKNPEFTLDNSAIKDVCPDMSFHADLKSVLRDTVFNLKELDRKDSDYDLLTDLVLLNNNGRFEGKVSEYIAGLSDERISEIQKFVSVKRRINNTEKLKNALRPIKNKLFG